MAGTEVRTASQCCASSADAHGLLLVTELVDLRRRETFLHCEVHVIEVGTRSMLNFDLLKEVGRIKKRVILKRGISATISEWLMAAESIAAGVNHDIMFCDADQALRPAEFATRMGPPGAIARAIGRDI